MLKQGLIILFSFFLATSLKAQETDSIRKAIKDISLDTLQRTDSTRLDSIVPAHDSAVAVLSTPIETSTLSLSEILKRNIFLNSSPDRIFKIQRSRNSVSKDAIFYSLAIILLFLGILRVAWPRYFSNLIRVFFNTSLRQGQLTDQLLQARLPSMFFNLFFVVIGSWYIFLLLHHYGTIPDYNYQLLMLIIAAVLIIYIAKYCTVAFAGWITGYKDEAETYIFIVFLINKIIALCLVPIVIIMPFSQPGLVDVVIVISYIMIIIMALMRFFRSYGLLQSRLKVSGFHFLLYLIGIELLPLSLIYKGALVIMSKNL